MVEDGSPALLSDELASRAREALDALSTALSALAPTPPDEPSLAVGAAGLALAHAYLGPLFPGRGHEDGAAAALVRAARQLETRRVAPWLFQGMAGVAWVQEHLAAAEEGADDAGDEVDVRLREVVEAARPLPFEWMHGIAGLAVYARERASRPSGRALLEAISARLVTSASASEEGTFWMTDPAWAPPQMGTEAHVNLGFAHGDPGAITALACAVQSEAASPRARDVLASACRWLVAQRLDASNDAWFGVSSSAHTPSKTAWCYGDPGVAWSLLVAGRALGDDAICGEAVAIAKHAAARSFEATRVKDAAFCHGAAGLAHVFHRMYRATGDVPLADAARAWLSRTLSMRATQGGFAGFRAWAPTAPGVFAWRDDPSLLNGAAGIALVLAGALEPASLDWDRALLGPCPAGARMARG